MWHSRFVNSDMLGLNAVQPMKAFIGRKQDLAIACQLKGWN